MPYIKPDKYNDVRATGLEYANNSGELNYQFTMLAIEYLEQHGLSYSTCNDISGALTECLAEFRRRVVAPYEDKKIAENGDVYPRKFTNASE